MEDKAHLFLQALEHLGEMLEGRTRKCYFDHNRNCQEHSWFGIEGECPVAKAFEFYEKHSPAPKDSHEEG